ncbi:MAG: formimidoylglutamate deiminase [Bacteroidota bacterium]
MKKYRFIGLLQKDGWHEDVSVAIDNEGKILSINKDHQDSERVNGLVLPGFQNAHSHAFQYAMAGLVENYTFSRPTDDFWSWRETMYQIALSIDPKDLESIAAMLYSEMVRHGYTHVAEFHYLHHDKAGKRYANLAEHGERLVLAAKTAGIKITLIPMFYQMGGFGKDPGPQQRRFISPTLDDYMNLWDASREITQLHGHASIGYGIHSLRAVNSQDIERTLTNNFFSGPFHIHVSEQLKEVDECISFLGLRPVEWLMNRTGVDSNCHLVHATHLTETEIKSITNRGAHVVLCPSTEGNLGDGIFPLRQFQELNGRWSVGTDSHIGLNPCEELRILDYAQRLTTHKRNTFHTAGYTDGSLYAFHQTLQSGRASMGSFQENYFSVSDPFDAVVFNAEIPLLANTKKEKWLSTILYCSESSWIKGTVIDGKWVVINGKHLDHEKITAAFKNGMSKLRIR